MNTFSLLSSSSASASLRASLTVYSFEPVGVAYVRIRGVEREEDAGRKDDRGAARGLCDNSRPTGRKSLEAAIPGRVLYVWERFTVLDA
jgi:hypothetical protein